MSYIRELEEMNEHGIMDRYFSVRNSLAINQENKYIVFTLSSKCLSAYVCEGKLTEID